MVGGGTRVYRILDGRLSLTGPMFDVRCPRLGLRGDLGWFEAFGELDFNAGAVVDVGLLGRGGAVGFAA